MIGAPPMRNLSPPSRNVRLWPTAAKLLILQAQGFPFLQCFTIRVRRAF
jgi:hypothetical protein